MLLARGHAWARPPTVTIWQKVKNETLERAMIEGRRRQNLAGSKRKLKGGSGTHTHREGRAQQDGHRERAKG